MHKEKILAGIWNSLTEYEYYFSIHALTHTIKIGKDLFFFFFWQGKNKSTNLRSMLLKFHNGCSAEITQKGIFLQSVIYFVPA